MTCSILTVNVLPTRRHICFNGVLYEHGIIMISRVRRSGEHAGFALFSGWKETRRVPKCFLFLLSVVLCRKTRVEKEYWCPIIKARQIFSLKKEEVLLKMIPSLKFAVWRADFLIRFHTTRYVNCLVVKIYMRIDWRLYTHFMIFLYEQLRLQTIELKN